MLLPSIDLLFNFFFKYSPNFASVFSAFLFCAVALILITVIFYNFCCILDFLTNFKLLDFVYFKHIYNLTFFIFAFRFSYNID